MGRTRDCRKRFESPFQGFFIPNRKPRAALVGLALPWALAEAALWAFLRRRCGLGRPALERAMFPDRRFQNVFLRPCVRFLKAAEAINSFRKWKAWHQFAGSLHQFVVLLGGRANAPDSFAGLFFHVYDGQLQLIAS